MATSANIGFPLPGAGSLDKRITVRLREDVPTGASGVDEQHPVAIQRWASLQPVGTAVWAASMQTDARVTHRAVLRFMTGVTDAHEVVYAGRVYRVRRAADLRSAGRFLVLDLEELGDEVAL